MKSPSPAAPRVLRALQAALLGSLVFMVPWASAQMGPPGRTMFGTPDFPAASGAEVYATVCQGCHMPAGKGAAGAGVYPALAANGKLASASYIVYTVVYGRKGMPALGSMLDDNQIAQVASYVRTSFGNNYADPVTVADVKALRTR